MALSRSSRSLLCLFLILGLAALGFWWWDRTPGAIPEEEPWDGPDVRSVSLTAVSNASGLELVTREGTLLVATVDEVDEWTVPNRQPPPLITFSSIEDGQPAGGQGKVASHGEVEALALREDRLVFPFKTGIQTVVIQDGDETLVLVDDAVIARLRDAVRGLVSGPTFFEFEGLAWRSDGWELLCAVVRPDARDTPASTMAVLRVGFDENGAFRQLSPPIEESDGELYTDYAAGLDVVGDWAVIPGFFRSRVVLVDWQGQIRSELRLPRFVDRVEGIRWAADRNELFLVRECVGDVGSCRDGVHFGVPLWIVSLPEGLVDGLRAVP